MAHFGDCEDASEHQDVVQHQATVYYNGIAVPMSFVCYSSLAIATPLFEAVRDDGDADKPLIVEGR